MSPVEIAVMAILSAMRSAWVPLPDPGGPMMSKRVMCCPVLDRGRDSGLSLAEQALVMALFHLCVDLFDRGQRYTNHNQNGGTTKWEVLVGADEHKGYQRQHRNQSQI